MSPFTDEGRMGRGVGQRWFRLVVLCSVSGGAFVAKGDDPGFLHVEAPSAIVGFSKRACTVPFRTQMAAVLPRHLQMRTQLWEERP